jgi:hypothetical protein
MMRGRKESANGDNVRDRLHKLPAGFSPPTRAVYYSA